MKFLEFEMSLCVVSHNSSRYFKMLHITEIVKFP